MPGDCRARLDRLTSCEALDLATRLHASRALRDETGLFVVEGVRNLVHAIDHGWTVDSIRPIVESCIEIFGVERSMFASNFPVDKLHASYNRVWGAYEEITAVLSEEERQRLFADTARRFYRID